MLGDNYRNSMKELQPMALFFMTHLLFLLLLLR